MSRILQFLFILSRPDSDIYLEIEVNVDGERSVSLLRNLERSSGHCPDVVVKCWMKSENSFLKEIFYFAIVGVSDPDFPIVSVTALPINLN